ncbi:mycothiol transferase [Streptomyces sp. NPDC003753]
MPEAPWSQSDERWTARRTLMHIISETARHSGHADTIRACLDGAKSTG